MEIRRLVRDPAEELGNVIVRYDCIAIRTHPCQFGIGEIGVYCPMADRMERYGLTPFLGLRHQMMLLDFATERSLAKPTVCCKAFLHHYRLAGMKRVPS